MDVLCLVRRAVLPGLVALAAFGLAACGPAATPDATPTAESQLNVQNASPTPASATAAPTQPIAPTAAAQVSGPQTIFIDSPAPGTLVGSPVRVAGRTQRMPAGGQLEYQVIGAGNQVIGSGKLPVGAGAGGGGVFDAPLTFNLPQSGGSVTAQLFEHAADGSMAAVSGLDMFVQSQVQSIAIDTPPPGTQVGSPMVLTGRLARLPSQGRLYYWVRNSSQQQIGAGSFDVFGEPGRPASFAGSLFFDLPFDGDTITAQIFDQDPASGATLATAPINLYVAPVPQQIAIDTPPPGALVGSPMTVTGRTVRFPANGNLSYRVTRAGVQIGAGSFAVGGTSTAGSQFNAQVAFSVPRDGGPIRLTIADQNTPSGVVESAIDLDVLAQYQAIAIDTPPPGTQVGSPMVLTGRTNWYPNSGQLLYRVLDAGNATIGSGAIPVAGAPGTRGSFSAQLTFAEPPSGGNIRAELTDQASGGAIVATAAIQLTVAPPPPPQILIDTPPPGTQVGSPMVLTGRTTFVPNGQLNYRVRDNASNVIGQGSFSASASGRQASFNAALTFTEPPAGGNITAEIFGPGPGGAQISASIMLYVAPRR